MAIIQFRDEVNKIEKTRRSDAPKSASIQGWYRLARKLIPEVPKCQGTDWNIAWHEASMQFIKIRLENSKGQHCWIVVNRTAPTMRM